MRSPRHARKLACVTSNMSFAFNRGGPARLRGAGAEANLHWFMQVLEAHRAENLIFGYHVKVRTPLRTQ